MTYHERLIVLVCVLSQVLIDVLEVKFKVKKEMNFTKMKNLYLFCVDELQMCQ